MLSTKAVVLCEDFSAVIFRRIELPISTRNDAKKEKVGGAVPYAPVRLGPPKSLGHDSAYRSKFSVFGVFRGPNLLFF